jgi:hypothetical protein
MPDYPLTSPAKMLSICHGRDWLTNHTGPGFWCLVHGSAVNLIMIPNVGPHLADQVLDEIRQELELTEEEFIAELNRP